MSLRLHWHAAWNGGRIVVMQRSHVGGQEVGVSGYVGALLLSLCLVLLVPVGDGSGRVPTLSPSDTAAEDTAVITIRNRTFEPERIPLRIGHKSRVIVHNTDAELHAFVPVGLLAGLHFHVLGDGAPQFDAHGLKRLIIPSRGTAEIRFVPERAGIFPYFCDMPGHEMSATIVVE